MNFHDSDVVACVAVFHRVPGFCVIFHARLHRNYTGIFDAPLYWQWFAGETRRRFTRRRKLDCLKKSALVGRRPPFAEPPDNEIPPTMALR
jgi:hypothetical protein